MSSKLSLDDSFQSSLDDSWQITKYCMCLTGGIMWQVGYDCEININIWMEKDQDA